MAAALESRPYVLRVGVTHDCNQHCLYCNPNGKRREDQMTDQDLLDLFTLAYRKDVREIHLTGGEPLMRKELLSILHEVRQPDLGFVMTTNGGLLEDRAVQLHEAGLRRVNVSIPSLNPAKHAKVTGSSRDYVDRKMQGLQGLQSLFDLVKINFVVNRQYNLDEVPAMIRFAQEHGFVLRLMELMPYSISGQGDRYFSENHVGRDELRLLLAQEGRLQPAKVPGNNWACEYWAVQGMPQPVGIDFHHSNQYVCPGAACRTIRISPDGLIAACYTMTNEYPPLGSLKGASFAEKEQLLDAVIQQKQDMEQGRIPFPHLHVPNYARYRGGLETI